MTDACTGLPPRGRWLALLLIVAIHIAALWCWPQRHPDPGAARSGEMAITFVAVAAPARSAAKPTPVAAVTRHAAKLTAPPKLGMILIPSLPAPTPTPVPAPVQKSADDIIGQARRDVGKIDRELRAASLDTAQRTLIFTSSKLERGLAGAFVNRGPPQVVEDVMNDGRRVSRIGNKCYYMESNGLVGGRDVFRDGIRTVFKNC